MVPASFLLVSPGSVDGYPPVQYQARLLADAGYAVELVTLPLHSGREITTFAHPGVRVTCLSSRLLGPGWTSLRIAALVRAVAVARWRLGRRNCVEICYDPIGLWISDLTPGKPSVRVAHFHEMLPNERLFIEKRLKRSIGSFDYVLVPDKERAKLTKEKLDLPHLPLVLENYPLRAEALIDRGQRATDAPFEVVYCGSLGLRQKLDTLIQSVPKWPENAVLSLIGRDDTLIAGRLRTLAKELGVAKQVRFTGWMDLHKAEAYMARADLGVALLDGSTEQWRTALGASNKRYQFMKVGLPQLGDSNPGVRELIEGNGIGACVINHNPERIAALVRTYAAAPARAVIEGRRAFALHQSVYNYEAVFRRFLDIWGATKEMRL